MDSVEDLDRKRKTQSTKQWRLRKTDEEETNKIESKIKSLKLYMEEKQFQIVVSVFEDFCFMRNLLSTLFVFFFKFFQVSNFDFLADLWFS